MPVFNCKLKTGIIMRLCVSEFVNLQEDASYTTEQLHMLLGLILDDGVIGVHCQNIVLQEKQMHAGKKYTERKHGGQWKS